MGALVVTAVGACGQDTVRIEAAAPAAADRAACRALLGDLPGTVADEPAREVASGEGTSKEVWGAAWGDPPIVLSCGSDEPAGFTRTSQCTTVNDIDWYVPEEQLEPGTDPMTLTTVNRAQYVRVDLPEDYFPPAAALVDLSAAVAEHIVATGSCH